MPNVILQNKEEKTRQKASKIFCIIKELLLIKYNQKCRKLAFNLHLHKDCLRFK